MAAVEPADGKAGVSYSQIVAQRLIEEGQRRTSLHTRATTTITGSGVLMTALFAIERAVGSNSIQDLGAVYRALFGAALIGLTGACIISFSVLWPQTTHTFSAAELETGI